MFDVEKIKISDEDLEKVEKLFEFRFNDGQKKVINHWKSVDIQACPGSGKTTTLAAKLIILAEKLPKNFERGICVITHTNVAVEEINEKLGAYAKFYSSYPNHFGTIQSFVNKFLAIPAYKNIYKHSPAIVDEDTYRREIKKIPILKGTLNLLEAKKEDIGQIVFNRHNFDISKNIDSDKAFEIKGLKPLTLEKHYKNILLAKNTMLKEGYMTYEEAYSFAFRYLREYPIIKNFVAKRFPFVFIDEMQDMEIHQSDIINDLFNATNCVIQRIGDINQSIFTQSKLIKWNPSTTDDLQLYESNRISDNIVQIIKDVCVSPQSTMTGRTNTKPIKPAVIVFNNGNIHQVKDVFGKLILQHGLSTKKKIKCVGSRIGLTTELNLNSYWQELNRKKEKIEFGNLISYVEYIKHKIKNTQNVKNVRKIFIELICKSLKICKIKNPITGFYFTPFSLLQYLISECESSTINDINTRIANWILKIRNGNNIICDLNDFIKEIIGCFGASINSDLNTFLIDTHIDKCDENQASQIYKFTDGDSEVNMTFDTIHKVKGETHVATLYLETYSHGVFDVGDKIIDFIVSDDAKKVKLRKVDACKKRLPMAYVALSRATDFVAIAVHKDRFTEEHKTYFDKNKDCWDCFHL